MIMDLSSRITLTGKTSTAPSVRRACKVFPIPDIPVVAGAGEVSFQDSTGFRGGLPPHSNFTKPIRQKLGSGSKNPEWFLWYITDAMTTFSSCSRVLARLLQSSERNLLDSMPVRNLGTSDLSKIGLKVTPRQSEEKPEKRHLNIHTLRLHCALLSVWTSKVVTWQLDGFEKRAPLSPES